MEFMQRLAALVPRTRLHLIRFHGVLAPNAKLRSKVVPKPAQSALATAAGEGDYKHAHSAPVRMTWACLLKRVFNIDIERCACGGKLKLIAVIEEPAVIEKILTHLGLSSQISRSTSTLCCPSLGDRNCKLAARTRRGGRPHAIDQCDVKIMECSLSDMLTLSVSL